MPRYEVLQDGFFNGVLHKPGDDRHGFVVTDKPIDPVPAWLKEVKEETAAERKKHDDHAKAVKAKVDAGKEEVKGASFLASQSKPGSVETL